MREPVSVWDNPFEKNLLEDWRLEEFPHHYGEMVSCFFSPEFMGKLEATDIKPKILMGGRGTGKSHILRMLSVQSVVSSVKIIKAAETGKDPENIEVSITDYTEPYLGVYLKSTIFSPLSTTNIGYLSVDQLRTLFEHLFNMQVCIAVLDGIKFLISNCIDIPDDKENLICAKLHRRLGQLFNVATLSQAVDSLNSQVMMVQKIVKEYPWYNDFSRFENDVNFTSAPDFIQTVFDVVREELQLDKVLFILLDEYDELDEYQQQFINRLIRSRTLTFRIASKIGGIKTLEYETGHELDGIHDYDPIISLHFETTPGQRRTYRNLLKNIFEKRLNIYGDYSINNPENILPGPTLADERISDEDVQNKLQEIRSNLKRRKEIEDPDTYWRNFEGHYKEAAIYRILRDNGRKDKLYAGFDVYVNLSSGIVRQFILLCRDVFMSAHSNGIMIEKGEPIPLKTQSETAEAISRHLLLTETIKSISSEHGPRLVRVIQDLGRILEAKLYWSTEPQANRFEVVDSQKFSSEQFQTLKEIIESGLKMPHFISEIAFKPKHPWYSVAPLSFSLNAIFAPTLRVPSGKRWVTAMKADELKDLCSEEKREITIEAVINEIRGKTRVTRGKKARKKDPVSDAQRVLFDGAVSLSNCPITDHGCSQNLIDYVINQGIAKKAFLAAPFDPNSWVYDSRRWIKTAMADQFDIRCSDIDDFGAISSILCKICSCVRQMPIGLFEITELNPNVIFELGMATALNRLSFMLVFPEKATKDEHGNFPPQPLTGIEYVPYQLSENSIIKAIEAKIIPTINAFSTDSNSNWCWHVNGTCPHDISSNGSHKIFVGLPYTFNESFFGEVEALLTEMLSEYNPNFQKQAKSLSQFCQICKEIRESSFCIVDTTSNDISMLFALGVAFGKDKKFIQLHNSSLSAERPLSDLKQWAIEYENIPRLQERLQEELPKRLGN